MEWAGTNLKEFFLSKIIIFIFLNFFSNSYDFFKANQEYAFDKMGLPGEGGVFET